MSKHLPAFPIRGGIYAPERDGMTLRDYFAAKADVSKFEVTSMEAAEELVGRPLPDDTAGQLAWQADLIAKARYAHADAMLRAREEAGRE